MLKFTGWITQISFVFRAYESIEQILVRAVLQTPSSIPENSLS